MYILRHPSARINMATSQFVYWCCLVVSHMTPHCMIPLVWNAHFEEEKMTKGVRQGLGILCCTVLHVLFLAILKYRAAHHRKIRKWQKFADDTKGDSQLKMYLRELLYFEAKAAPIDSLVFNEVWNLTCSTVVSIIFPRPVALVYLLCLVFAPFTIFIRMPHYSDGPSKFVYNGQRYRSAGVGLYHLDLEGEKQSILYYPLRDFFGLIPLGDE
ncbi:hypothetical protein PSACC_02193 [Paramicrosporidium saccamoebae]|uniref:Uncharacterized protein n=1 Tax=Paramicrosporidium saccamoebae TaxID=1246581 RepID=A0A2H9TJR4_9FUNG|nr:hypothetical protein PSACC_02193 [Paramicrosporidium saccamoebae]